MSTGQIVRLLLLVQVIVNTSIGTTAMSSSSMCTERTACWRRPRGCAGTRCDYAAEWSVNEDTDEITLAFRGRSDGWVAVGFSGDQAMAGDDVLMCIADPPGAGANSTGARFEHRYNYGYSNLPAESEGITVNSASFTDGILQCFVTRDLTAFNSSHMTFDLSSDWFMLFAQGPISSSGLPVRHSVYPAITDMKVSLSSLDEVFVLGEAHRPSPGQGDGGGSEDETGRDNGSSAIQLTGHWTALFVCLRVLLISW